MMDNIASIPKQHGMYDLYLIRSMLRIRHVVHDFHFDNEMKY